MSCSEPAEGSWWQRRGGFQLEMTVGRDALDRKGVEALRRSWHGSNVQSSGAGGGGMAARSF